MATFGPQSRVETSIDKVPVTPMTAEQIAQLYAEVDVVRALRLPQLHDAKDPHSKMFVMALDGTQNDAVNDAEHATNVGLISRSIKTSHIEIRNVDVGYRVGVGNQKFIAGMADSIVGYTVSDQANKSYMDFVETANLWHREDPDVKISLAGIGFSRGASALLIASNMMHEKGIPDLASAVKKTVVNSVTGQSHAETSYSRYIVLPGQVPQALILNDQVATGRAEDMDRRVAPSVVSVVQLQAQNEHRAPFPFYSTEDPAQLDPRIHTIKIAGSHSDVGGAYLLNGISSVTRQINEILLNKLGANIPESTPEADPKKYVIHDSEYLWGDRHAGSPTPPVETRDERKVIYDKGPGHGLSNPIADDHLLQKYAPSANAVLMRSVVQANAMYGLTEAQRAIILARMQDNLANTASLQYESTKTNNVEMAR